MSCESVCEITPLNENPNKNGSLKKTALKNEMPKEIRKKNRIKNDSDCSQNNANIVAPDANKRFKNSDLIEVGEIFSFLKSSVVFRIHILIPNVAAHGRACFGASGAAGG